MVQFIKYLYWLTSLTAQVWSSFGCSLWNDFCSFSMTSERIKSHTALGDVRIIQAFGYADILPFFLSALQKWTISVGFLTTKKDIYKTGMWLAEEHLYMHSKHLFLKWIYLQFSFWPDSNFPLKMFSHNHRIIKSESSHSHSLYPSSPKKSSYLLVSPVQRLTGAATNNVENLHGATRSQEVLLCLS